MERPKQILLAWFFLVNTFSLFHILCRDEVVWMDSAARQIYVNYPLPHPPLSIWVHNLVFSILGNNPLFSRIIILAIGICALLLFIKMIKTDKLFSNDFFLVLISFPLYFLSLTQIDIDGSFLALFIVLTLYFFRKYEVEKKKKLLSLTGLAYGFGILSKFPAVITIFVIFLYSGLKYRNLRKTVRETGFIAFTSLAVVIPGLFMSGESSFYTAFYHAIHSASQPVNLSSLFIQICLALLWLGPSFFPLIISFLYKNRGALLYQSWVLIFAFFYLFVVQDSFRPLERYIEILILPSALVVSTLMRDKKVDTSNFFAAFIAFSSLYIFIPLGNPLNFLPKTNLFSEIAGGNLIFPIPLGGSSGPIGFYFPFLWVFLAFISGFVAFSFYILTKKQKYLSILMIISLSYSFTLASENAFYLKSPDISSLSYRLIDEIKTNRYDEPIYIFRNYALRYYLPEKNITTLDFENEFNPPFPPKISGTVVILDYPQINKGSEMWQQIINDCNLVKEYYEKSFLLGYIFDCNP